MRFAPTPRVIEPSLDIVRAVRTEVLRNGTPSSDPTYPRDEDAETFHLGLEIDDEVVAVSTWMPETFMALPSASGIRLRGMAVRAPHQGQGWGALLVATGLGRAANARASIVWAAARDSAIPFYERLGWRVEGDGFVDEVTGLGHHHMWVSVAPVNH